MARRSEKKTETHFNYDWIIWNRWRGGQNKKLLLSNLDQDSLEVLTGLFLKQTPTALLGKALSVALNTCGLWVLEQLVWGERGRTVLAWKVWTLMARLLSATKSSKQLPGWEALNVIMKWYRERYWSNGSQVQVKPLMLMFGFFYIFM